MKLPTCFVLVLFVLTPACAPDAPPHFPQSNSETSNPASHAKTPVLNPSVHEGQIRNVPKIPDSTIRDVSINQFAGGILFRSESFSSYLSSSVGAKITALNDKRHYPFDDIGMYSLDGDNTTELARERTNGILANPNYMSDHRVCDLAYLLLVRDSDPERFGYRDNYEKRDKLIARMLETIQDASQQESTLESR